MNATAILAIDQGTTNSKALLVSPQQGILARASRAMQVSHPQAGWAELDADVIWSTVRETIDELVTAAEGQAIAALAITNQRESILLWDAVTGAPLTPCVIWQCRRTSEQCADLRQRGLENDIMALSGLAIDPLFPAAKIAWLLDNTSGLRERAVNGNVKAGTVDSWLIWQLTAGKVHATDASNASRTQLMNLNTGQWDQRLAEWFDVPLSMMPDIRHSDAGFGETAAGICRLPAGVPIQAVMGDSHAALYGHGVRELGEVKVTLGTGSSMMTLMQQHRPSSHGLSSTIAWAAKGKVYHALEGNISVSGQAAAFAVQLLNVADEQALTDLAQSVADSGGVTFVPALAGLGAPHWLDQARGQISGMSLGTRPAHVARATLEAIALQINDLLQAMEADLELSLAQVSVDGGAANNDFLMQLLANILNRTVIRPAATDMSALGVAQMAACALGIVLDVGQCSDKCVFTPQLTTDQREVLLQQWQRALRQLQH